MAHTLIGTVTSDKRDKTITVSIVSRETHPLYRKQYSKTRKYTAHDANNEAHEGDRVQIAMSRPISKTKAYTLVKVLEKARGTVELKEDVNKAYEAEKVGADAEARARRAAEKQAAEEAAEAEKTAEKAEKAAAKKAAKESEQAEGEDK
ncbi:MAG: 30S ribosomal protein S17 [Candidatus Saccharibacteria bacterium]|nr:30S ribosomal protein S17 [Candidatus Saccharibacteria bacterium]